MTVDFEKAITFAYRRNWLEFVGWTPRHSGRLAWQIASPNPVIPSRSKHLATNSGCQAASGCAQRRNMSGERKLAAPAASPRFSYPPSSKADRNGSYEHGCTNQRLPRIASVLFAMTEAGKPHRHEMSGRIEPRRQSGAPRGDEKHKHRIGKDSHKVMLAPSRDDCNVVVRGRASSGTTPL